MAADAPVGAVGDHIPQPRFAVFGVERCHFDSIQRKLAKRFGRFVFREHANAFIHADEPLRRRAVNYGRFMPPAMRVAVDDGRGRHEAVALSQHFNDARAGLPDIQTTEQGQFFGVRAVALHGVENLVVFQTVRDAGIKVVQTIRGRRVNDARAVAIAHVVGKVQRREAVVTVFTLGGIDTMQRVAEHLSAQRFALGGGENRAFEFVTLQAFFDQGSAQQQHAARRIHQRVVQFGVRVQSLVGGNRPRGGRPNHGEGFFRTVGERFGQCAQTKCGSKRSHIIRFKRHIQRIAFFVRIFNFKFGQG